MEQDSDKLFNDEVRSFIRVVLNKHEQDAPVSTHPVSAYGSTDNRVNLVPSLIIWDPFTQIANFPRDCFVCGQPLKRRSWKDGHSSRDNPRVLYGIDQPVLLIGCLYACSKDHRVLSHDRKVTDLCEERLIPFVLLHKVGVTKSLLSYIVSHVTAGLNFRSIETTSSSIWHMAAYMGVHCLPPDKRMHDIWQPPTRKTMMAFYTYHYFMNLGSYNAMMEAITGEWLSMDHTFKTAANVGQWDINGKWRKIFNSVFLILNEKQEVLSWTLSKTTGFINVQQSLRKLRDRLAMNGIEVRGIIIDNCCQWKDLLRKIFGNVPIKLDLFHGVKRVTGTISKKHFFFHAFKSEFRMVFRHTNDRARERKMATPSTSKILENFNTFVSRWEVVPGSPTEDSKTMASLINLKKHVEQGCLSDIPPSVGTNPNENIHKNLKNKISTNKKGLTSALASFGHFFYDWNQRRKYGKVAPIELQFCPPPNLNENFGAYVSADVRHDVAYVEQEDDIHETEEEEREFGNEDNCLALLGVTSDEIEMIRCWSDHCVNLRERFKGHSDFRLANLVFWSNYLFRLFPKEEPKDNNHLQPLLDAHGLVLISEGSKLLATVGRTLQLLKKRVPQHLENLKLEVNDDIVSKLRSLIKEEVAANEHRYYSFFKESLVGHVSKWLKRVTTGGDLDDDKFALPVLATVLQIPIVVFTTSELFPVVNVIPSEQMNINTPSAMIIAYNRKDGTFFAVDRLEETKEPCISTSGLNTQSISCNCGASKKSTTTKCDSYNKRCVCFQKQKGCHQDCKCVSCNNPFGKNEHTSASTSSPSTPRKRSKTKMQSTLAVTKIQSTNIMDRPKQLDESVMIMSVINFCISQDLSFDLDLIVSLSHEALPDTTMTKTDLASLSKKTLNLFHAFALVLDVKL